MNAVKWGEQAYWCIFCNTTSTYGDLFSLFVQVYDANLAPVSTAPVVITATADDGKMVSLEAVTDVSGIVEAPVVVGNRSVKYVVTVDGVTSKPLVLAPETLPVVSP